MFKFKDYSADSLESFSTEELESIVNDINEELKKREMEKKTKLIDNFLLAFRTLVENGIRVSVGCELEDDYENVHDYDFYFY